MSVAAGRDHHFLAVVLYSNCVAAACQPEWQRNTLWEFSAHDMSNMRSSQTYDDDVLSFLALSYVIFQQCGDTVYNERYSLATHIYLISFTVYTVCPRPVINYWLVPVWQKQNLKLYVCFYRFHIVLHLPCIQYIIGAMNRKWDTWLTTDIDNVILHQITLCRLQ